MPENPHSVPATKLQVQKIRNRPTKNSDDFEIRVFGFLEAFYKEGLIHELAGGPRNDLGTGQQIDVSFDWDNHDRTYFFIFECKNHELPNIKTFVEELKVRADQVERLYVPQHYSNGTVVKPVLALSNERSQLNFNLESLDLLNFQYSKLPVDSLEYYERLLHTYGAEYTFPVFLKEVFGLIPEYGEPLRVPALRCERFGKELYTFQVKAADLLRISYVYRARPGTVNDKAYQRILEAKRLDEIGSLLRERKFEVNFPNNIVVNLSSGSFTFKPFDPNGFAGYLEIQNKYGTVWVIDGQHRLYSFLRSGVVKDEFELIVTGFVNLNYQEQSMIFATINSSAKRVIPDLIDYLFTLELPRSHIGSAAKICMELSDEGIFDENTLYLGFEKPRKRPQYLGLHALVRVLTNEKKFSLITSRGGQLRINKDDEDIPKRLLRDYFMSIKTVLHNDWQKGKEGYVKTADGLAVFLALLDKILRIEGKSITKLKQADFDKYLTKLKGTRWSDIRHESSSSEADRSRIVKGLLAKLSR